MSRGGKLEVQRRALCAKHEQGCTDRRLSPTVRRERRRIHRTTQRRLFQADNDLWYAIAKAVRRQAPAIDFASAQEAGLDGLSDPELLDRAALEARVLVSQLQREKWSEREDSNLWPPDPEPRFGGGGVVLGFDLVLTGRVFYRLQQADDLESGSRS